MQSNTAYRFAVGLALTAAFLIIWLNADAGLIGIEDDDPANLLYVGVLPSRTVDRGVMTAKGPLWNVLGAGIASSPASKPSRGGEAGVNLEAISVTGIADDLVELAIVGDDPKKTKRSLNSSDAHSCGRRTLPPVAVSHLATPVARE